MRRGSGTKFKCKETIGISRFDRLRKEKDGKDKANNMLGMGYANFTILFTSATMRGSDCCGVSNL